MHLHLESKISSLRAEVDRLQLGVHHKYLVSAGRWMATQDDSNVELCTYLEFHKSLVCALLTSAAWYKALLHSEMKAMRKAEAALQGHVSHVEGLGLQDMANRVKHECRPRSEIRRNAMELEFRLINLENALNEMTDPPSDPCDDEVQYGSRLKIDFTGMFIAKAMRLAPQCLLKVMRILHENMETFNRVMNDMDSVVDHVVSTFTEIRDEITSLVQYGPAKILDLVTPLFLTVRLVELHLSRQRANAQALEDAFEDLTEVIKAQPELTWEGDTAVVAEEYEHIVGELRRFLTIEAAERYAWESSRLKGKRAHMEEYTVDAIGACNKGDVDSALRVLREQL